MSFNICIFCSTYKYYSVHNTHDNFLFTYPIIKFYDLLQATTFRKIPGVNEDVSRGHVKFYERRERVCVTHTYYAQLKMKNHY